LREIVGEVRRRITDVRGSSEQVFLFDIQSEGRTDSGDPFELAMLALGEFDGEGLQRRAEWFEPEQVDEALSRFDELTAASSPLPRTPRRVRPNLASECLTGVRIDDHLDAWASQLRA